MKVKTILLATTAALLCFGCLDSDEKPAPPKTDTLRGEAILLMQSLRHLAETSTVTSANYGQLAQAWGGYGATKDKNAQDWHARNVSFWEKIRPAVENAILLALGGAGVYGFKHMQKRRDERRQGQRDKGESPT